MKEKIKILFTRRRLNVQQIIKTYVCLTGGCTSTLYLYRHLYTRAKTTCKRGVRYEERGRWGGVGDGCSARRFNSLIFSHRNV